MFSPSLHINCFLPPCLYPEFLVTPKFGVWLLPRTLPIHLSNSLIPTPQEVNEKAEMPKELQPGFSQEKKESHQWLEQQEEEEAAKEAKEQEEEAKEAVEVPKELQCSFCNNLLEAAILLPCCVAAACDECARNSLIEQVGGTFGYFGILELS